MWLCPGPPSAYTTAERALDCGSRGEGKEGRQVKEKEILQVCSFTIGGFSPYPGVASSKLKTCLSHLDVISLSRVCDILLRVLEIGRTFYTQAPEDLSRFGSQHIN